MVLSGEITEISLGLCGISLISWGIAVGFSVKAHTSSETISVIHV